MSFPEWALDHPQELQAYKFLIERLDSCDQYIQKQEQIIADAKVGIEPVKDRLSDGFSALQFDTYAFLGLQETEEEREERIIHRNKERHQQELELAITTAELMLHGNPGIGHDGYYNRRTALLKEIESFNPADHITHWAGGDGDDTDSLQRAIDERFIALGWDHHSAGVDQLIVDIEEIELVHDYPLRVSCTLQRGHWIVVIGDDTCSFTKANYVFEKALMWSLRAYLDRRWDYLVNKF